MGTLNTAYLEVGLVKCSMLNFQIPYFSSEIQELDFFNSSVFLHILSIKMQKG